ncbi:MAG: helix-turn-helix domain-containing protein [Pseudobdellovibrionaceae bacterium]
MPAKAPSITKIQEIELLQLGQQIRNRRKELDISATTTAEAAGVSRVTLYRIERGEPSVTMGAYLNVIQALGVKLMVIDPQKTQIQKNRPRQKVPKKIRVGDYKQLKRIAWQLKESQELNPQEVLDLYERNWRHIDHKAMDARERKLIEMLLAATGREKLLV